MKILIAHKTYGYLSEVNSNFVPRVGDSVDRFHQPFPKVVSVIAYPDEATLSQFQNQSINLKGAEAIVIVE